MTQSDTAQNHLDKLGSASSSKACRRSAATHASMAPALSEHTPWLQTPSTLSLYVASHKTGHQLA